MFAFVMPLIHPEHKRVGNFDRTLMALRGTLETLLRQTNPDIAVVVCCHRLPPWHEEIDPRVHFLVFEDHPELPFEEYFVYNCKASIVDQGLKNSIGSAYAIDRLNAEYIMVMDADDFVRTDLVQDVLDGKLPAMGRDGWNLSGGYNIEIENDETSLKLRNVYEVRGFHRNCGSCRVFSSAALDGHFDRIAPHLADVREQLPHASKGIVPSTVIEAVLKGVRADTSQHAPFMVFAVHKRQERLFDFADVSEAYGAKGCGHSNHAGHDGIFWYRVIRQCPVAPFMREFGWADVPFLKDDADPINQMRTRFRAFRSKLQQIPTSLRVRLGWLVAR